MDYKSKCIFSADGRSKPGLCSSHDALMTMFSSHNIHCSIVHPIKGSSPGSLMGGKFMFTATNLGVLNSYNWFQRV